MANGDRCLLVHGHFYQPPRENPWTGQIDPQYSAAPWENWNRRIADECYLPMARSRVYNHEGKIVDLYNNYAHTSFNFGPTLLSWIAEVHPSLLRHLGDATVIDRTFAMAQVYNHMMMPLADARDRHTQILWGLREFQHRFGFSPQGLWLSECGIDPETLRALIDHHIKFVILSPHQASKARPFGQAHWNEASMGSIDTRRGYRLFETDGGGRTHFDRYLDIIFYTPGLNLKVSFDHILNRPDDLARELENCFMPDYDGSQIVSIVTDGEIYGHHEKHGEEALSRLFREIAPSLGLKVVSPWEFIRDNPPTWEVKLWDGEDKRGSSWSCSHGVGRWFRDCGCRPPCPPDWNQRWRGPVREAFDALRDRVRFVSRRELGGLVWDADEARDDYIRIVLDWSPACRRDFLLRNARKKLSLEELEMLWRMLEAEHNAMLMYASCGWFFDEVSGLEPVQNMRYALRAAELIQPHHDEDLIPLLESLLSRAKSNIPHWNDGGKIFRELVKPSRHSNRDLAAAMAVCLAADFPRIGLSWKLIKQTGPERIAPESGLNLFFGSFVCLDPRMDRFIKVNWVTHLDDFDNIGVALHGYQEIQGDPERLDDDCPLEPELGREWTKELSGIVCNLDKKEIFNGNSRIIINHDRMPEVVRAMLYRRFSGRHEDMLLEEAAAMGKHAVPFLARARKHGARVPETITKVVTSAFEQEMSIASYNAVADMRFDDAAVGKEESSRRSAWELGLDPSRDLSRRSVFLTGMELLHWLNRICTDGWFAKLKPRDLGDGREWLAPHSQVNHDLLYPSANAMSLALGRGLAGLWSRLKNADDKQALCAEAIRILPLPELLEYAKRLGLGMEGAVALGMEYWDFLDKPLARMIQAGVPLEGEVEERIRRIGDLLNFESGAIDLRLRQAQTKAEASSGSADAK